MVSQLTSIGRRFDRKGEPFRRRSALPVLILVAVLAVLAIATWARALASQEAEAAPVSCPSPPAPSSPAPATTTRNAHGGTASAAPAGPAQFTVVPPSDLVSVRPAPLAATTVRVLNASGQSGRAETTLSKLADYGFVAPASGAYGNDPLYPQMECQAQIRFGDSGRAAAAAVWIIAPCAELINDGRKDATVDLTLGTFFTDLEPSTDAQEILRILRAAPANAADGGANPALVAAVHDQSCNR